MVRAGHATPGIDKRVAKDAGASYLVRVYDPGKIGGWSSRSRLLVGVMGHASVANTRRGTGTSCPAAKAEVHEVLDAGA